MRPEAVRFHLSFLVGDGRVATTGARRSPKRGRPTKLYGLSEAQRGQNIAGLAQGLLNWLKGEPAARKRAAYDVILRELQGQLGETEPGTSAPKRLGSLVGRLNFLHYEASWEAGADGPRILFAHCPYAAIIAEHPELCRIDARLLSTELGHQAVQTSKIQAGPDGPKHCIFAVR